MNGRLGQKKGQGAGRQSVPEREIRARETLRALKEVFTNGLLYKNPALIGAIGLCPVVAAGITLKNGVALSLLLGAMLLPTCLLFSLVGQGSHVAAPPDGINPFRSAIYPRRNLYGKAFAKCPVSFRDLRPADDRQRHHCIPGETFFRPACLLCGPGGWGGLRFGIRRGDLPGVRRAGSIMAGNPVGCAAGNRRRDFRRAICFCGIYFAGLFFRGGTGGGPQKRET